MIDESLSLAARASVTLTTLALVVVMHRALFRHSSAAAARGGAVALAIAFAIAATFSHAPPLVTTLGHALPIGLALGIGAAIASLFFAPARRALDALDDGDVRALLSFRAIFGAFLFALAALGRFPISFALSAGLGDLAVGWLALAVPVRLDARGPRWARLLVHGVGLADMTTVVYLAVTVVRPWSIAHDNATTSVTLPWLAVPLMFALNAHGVRRAARSGTEAVGDRSESARRVRSALS
jgi:hypothetical protein